MSSVMNIKKGDYVTGNYFKLPIDNYTPGGTLFFAAKPMPDNDATDAAAVIDKSFDDSSVTIDATYATWDLIFEPDDVVGVSFASGEKVKKYLGEFQFVDSGGHPSSFPAGDDYIQVNIYADIKRGVV